MKHLFYFTREEMNENEIEIPSSKTDFESVMNEYLNISKGIPEYKIL